MKQIRFLSISSVRSGSTWLQTMLGELSDVSVDFEFKRRKTEDYHVEIAGPDFRCSNKLSEVSATSPIVGSRITLDVEETPLPPEVYWYMSSTIDEEIRVIHLTRNYADVLFSYFRGSITVLADSDRADDSALYRHLTQVTKKNTTGIFTSNRHPWIDRLVFQNPIGRIVRRVAPQRVRDYLDLKQRYGMTPETGERMVSALFEHDCWVSRLATKQSHYLRIDYDEINDRFEEVAGFIGSQASRDSLRGILQSPPTKKLASLPPSRSVRDVEGLRAICEKYEQKKAALFAGS